MYKESLKKDRYKVGSLFAGIGGTCKGFIDADFDVKWAIEFDKSACMTYRENFSHRLIEGDIHDVDPSKLPEIDIIASGFPCQAFSIAGYQKGFSDSRGDLFFETMRFIDILKPKAILLENVKNLESHDQGNTIRVIKEFIQASGYSYMSKILNTMEYANLPQNRERVYIVGFRDEGEYWGSLDDRYICSRNFKFPSPISLNKTTRDLLEKEKVDDKYYYNKSKYYKIFRETEWKRDTVYQWRRMYLRENKNNVCPTLTANMGTGGHNVPLIRDSFDIRKLTPRECTRFQGFPHDFVLPKNVANSQLYKQIGNSVSIPVIKRIAENINQSLDLKYAKEMSIA